MASTPRADAPRVLSWRERFLIRFGPGVMAGVTTSDWLRLLRDNRFSVDRAYLPRAAGVSLSALVNSVFRFYEDRRYGRRLEGVDVPPPLFVLGHWRSGTTHLHYLLGTDRRFACPGFYQVMYPHTFLATEGSFSALQGFLLPDRRPYDDVRLDLSVPCEDEFAMCASGCRSPYLAGVFPRRAAHYDRFLTFRDASREDVEQWKAALLAFFRKLTLKHGRPLIVKSPAHTGRIKLLLEMFPGAKFVHIRRDPYAVFRSAVHTYETGLPWGRLQETGGFNWAGRITRQYRELYDAFFEERALVPAGHFHEVCYEALERDPVGEVRRLYAALGLPPFEAAEPALREYVDSVREYRKNAFTPLPPDQRRRVAAEWRRCFEEWGYPTD
jgi:omega-hydroxy-beta-dihydromenaquinone-9 sulfotransferase